MNIKNLRKNKKGFTLIEIIVVVVILAVLMAVAVPSVLKYMGEADDAKYMAQGRAVMTTAQAEIIKAHTSGNMIDNTELDAIKAAATYNDNAGGLEAVSAVEVYSAGTVTQVGDEIKIVDAVKYIPQTSAQTTVPELAVVSAKVGEKYIVAAPNGKIYVSKDAPEEALKP